MQQPNIPEKEEFEAWLALPTTQLYFHSFLPRAREILKDAWASGVYNRDTLEATSLANRDAVIQATTYQDLSELDYEKFHEVLTNDEG